MHKKHTKPKFKDHRHSGNARRGHVKNKETDDSILEIIKAPQNSRNEISKKLGFGDFEVKEKSKAKKTKHKHKKDEVKSSEAQTKSKHEKKSAHNFASIRDLVLDKEPAKHKEKKEKRDKERFNKIEKYLESLNKITSKKLLRNRSLSVKGSKAMLTNQEKRIRREKTFHNNTSRDASTNSRLGSLDAKGHQPPLTTKDKPPKHKKHKHREDKKREYSQEKGTKVNQQSVLYCEVELQSPFLQDKNKYNVGHLSPETAKERSSRKRSSSRDQSAPPQLHQRDKITHEKDRKMDLIKSSPRKFKLRTDLRNLKDQRSNTSLGPYGKYFVFDKIPQNEQEPSQQKKKKRRKEGGTTKKSRNEKRGESKEDTIQIDKTKKHQEKDSSHSDPYKAKIEDDIKSYFSKIQTLIDKKLDFILGNSSNSKESKSNYLENENEVEATKSKKDKKSKYKEEQQTRDRSHSKKRKHGKHESLEECLDRSLEEELKVKHSDYEKHGVREAKRIRNAQPSNVSLKRERYPSENSRNHKRHQSPQERLCQVHRSTSPPVEKLKSDKGARQDKHHKSPYVGYSAHKMSPDRLIKMLEHPSTCSIQSTTSLFRESVGDEMKSRPNDIQAKETEYYQNRDRSLSKRKTVHDEDDLRVEILEKINLEEAFSKKIHKGISEPPPAKSNTLLKKKSNVEQPKYRPDLNDSEQHYKRGKTVLRRAMPGEDDFEVVDAQCQQQINKKLKKRMRQLMNLECKTVSIVGIPSQIRDSAIFNETQTTTSLNVINLKEDIVEQKKKSKRFKLYYKYSVADNKCPNESDKSSEGKKSIVSDSYRVVSDPSDHNIEVWEDKDEIPKNIKKEPVPDLGKILFVMKKDSTKKHRKRADSPKPITLNNIVEEPSNISIMIHASESPPLLRKDLNCTFFKTLKSSSSDCNLSLVRKPTHKDKNKNRHPEKLVKDKTTRPKSPPKKERDHQRDVKSDKKTVKCEEKREHSRKLMKIDSFYRMKKKNRKYTNIYTSKSDINISYDSLKKYEFKKRKHRADVPSQFEEQIRQCLPEIFFKGPDLKSIDLMIKEEIREIIREIPRNVMREMSSSKESKQTDMSVNTCKLVGETKDIPETNSKELSKNSIIQNVEETTCRSEKIPNLNENCSAENHEVQKIEEETNNLREVAESNTMDLKASDEDPKVQNVEKETNYTKEAKEPNVIDLKQSVENSENRRMEEEVDCPKEIVDVQEANLKHSNESPKTQNLDEKTYCSKKIGTHNPMTRIPSLIKGYTSQVAKEECMETRNLTLTQVNQHEIPEDLVEELDEKILVDATTEVTVTEENLEMSDKAVIMLENKKSQTPSYLDTPTVVAICDPMKQCKYPKKMVTAGNIKHYQIIDSFGDAKIGPSHKSTRPIINLENSQFPNRKLPEVDRAATPPSEQYHRQRSILSDEEKRTVKFETQGTPQPRKFLERRPATVDDRRREPSSPLDKFRQKPTKPALTISTNIFTIDASKSTESTPTKLSRRDINQCPEQNDKRPLNKRNESFRRNMTQDNLTSKSSKSLNDVDTESDIGSLVCVEGYSNGQKINFSSNSNSKSLDRYTTKSIINDNPHSSRLFLTKNFDPKMNTYQRRKMYDDSIRKKMKKKHGTKNEMGPRIFEVRYLTLENSTLNESTDPTPVVNQKCISRFPTYNTKTKQAKLRMKTSTKPSTKKSKRHFPKNKEDACKFSGRDIFAPIISDVDQLNKFRRKAFPDKKVEEIFVKDASVKPEKDSSDREQNSSTTLKEKVIKIDQVCNEDKINSDDTNQNFKQLIDCLYNSIISYCDTKFNQSSQDATHVGRGEETLSKSPPVNEKSYVIFPKPPNETTSLSDLPYKKNASSEGNVTNEEKECKRSTNLVCSHLSCPVLAGSTSSFDYLYEDEPVELNKDAVLIHFKKPLKTILGYALNNTNRIEKETFRHLSKKTSNSVSESDESGYTSSNSKKCASVCSFFKKPSIVNLFKPENKLETSLQSTSSLNDSRSGPNFQEYNVMNKKCIEYAEKVRSQTQNKDKTEETFQEIPLDVLLQCRKSSAALSDFNSNCSLCKKHSHADLPDITEADELSFHGANMENENRDRNLTEEDKTFSILHSGNIREESVIFCQDFDSRSSLEVITVQQSQTSFLVDDSQLVKDMVQCPVVLSITNLNSYSLTVVEDNNNFCCDQKKNLEMIGSNHIINLKEDCRVNHSDLKSSTQSEFDYHSDVSSNVGFRCASSSGAATKYMAKKFFDNLLKVYEKEIDVTNKLFQDDGFFINVLLESVNLGEMRRPKNFKLKTMFKGKIRNCIGSMFGPKKSGSKIDECLGGLEKDNSNNNRQRKLQILASDARKYFSMFVQAVRTNKDINDEIKICGLLRLLERIEDGDFTILRKKEEVDFEEEIKEQVKEAFVNIYQMSVKEARKRKRSLTTDDLRLIRTFVSKYRIGLLSKTDLIATYIGRGAFKTEGHLKAAVTYLIQQNKTKDIDLKDFDERCKILAKFSV